MLTAADDMAFYRTINMPSRKIGKQKIALIKEYSEEHNLSAYNALKELVGGESAVFKGTGAQKYIDAVEKVRQLANGGRAKLGDILQAILDESGYEAFLRIEADQDRLDNLAEFKRAVNEEGLDDDATLPGLLSHLALFTDLDADGTSGKDTVKLLTIHAAKGMEFPYVFICGLNEGIFPSRKVLTPEDMEEERRIAYVAFTRAKNGLFLSDAEGKANDGIFKYPSRFIFDAGFQNLELVKELDKNLVEQTQSLIDYDEKRLSQMKNLFSPGDRVVHPVFGAGTVVLTNEKASCYTIKFDSLSTERSIQFAAKLEKE